MLEKQYDTAKLWGDYIINYDKEVSDPNSGRPEYCNYINGVREADYLFDTRFHFGEWLEPNSDESGDPSEQDLEAIKNRTELKNKSGLKDKPETQFGFWLFLMKEIQLF